MEKQTSKKKWVAVRRAMLSLFICFHLFAIITLANGSSFLGRYFQDVLLPYGNTFGLNTTWNFFSPDPAHVMYINYRVYFEDEFGNEVKEPVLGSIPPNREQISIDSSKRRFLYAMRFLLLDTQRVRTILAPWVCHQNPGASRLYIEYILERIPPLDQARLESVDPGFRFPQEKLVQESLSCEQFNEVSP